MFEGYAELFIGLCVKFEGSIFYFEVGKPHLQGFTLLFSINEFLNFARVEEGLQNRLI